MSDCKNCGRPEHEHFSVEWLYEGRVKLCPTATFEPFVEPGEPLTGKQLRFAVEHNLKVRMVIKHHDPHDQEKDEDVICGFEPAGDGWYYVGSTDICPKPEYHPDEESVTEEDGRSFFGIYPAPGVEYGK